MNINLDKLFAALPRDLQWEILTEFVGTHSVRNGKLMRKLIISAPYKTLKNVIFHVNPKYAWYYSKYGTISIPPEIPCFLSEAVNILSYVMLSDGSKILYCEGTFGRKMSCVIFRTATKIVEDREIWDHERFLIDDSVVLDPFEKHSYPSYPYTNKKMRRNN